MSVTTNELPLVVRPYTPALQVTEKCRHTGYQLCAVWYCQSSNDTNCVPSDTVSQVITTATWNPRFAVWQRFWFVSPCSLIGGYLSFWGLFISEDGSSKFLRNTDEQPADVSSVVNRYVRNRHEESTRKQLKLLWNLNGEVFKLH
jgi:hypothetical protein